MKKTFLLALTVVGLAGCYNDNKEDLTPTTPPVTTCDVTDVSFSSTIQPIFRESCATSGCHNSTSKAGTYDLSNHAGAKAASSRIAGAINHLSGYSQMPQGAGKLSDCKIDQIESWLNAGAPNN